MFRFLLLLLFHLPLCVQSRVLYQEVSKYHNETSEKAEFAYEVVDKIYGAFRQWFFTIIFCDFTYFENRILKYTETKDYGYPVILINGCPNNDTVKVKPKIDKHGQTAYIVTSETLSVETNDFALRALIRTGVFKPRAPVIFVIIVPIKIENYFYHTMIQHFQMIWGRHITNSVLVIWCNRLRIYTYNPYFNEVSEVTDVEDLTGLLAKQYYNLYGRELRLSVFRKVYLYDDTGPVLCDSRTTLVVMHQLNATCLPLPPRDGNTVGDLLENGTATGVTADLIDGYTDLELNSRILKNTYYGYIDTTYPLGHDELCFIVRKSDKQSTFTTTIKLITTKILTIFLLIVAFLMFLAVLARKVEEKLFNLENQTTSSILMDMTKCFLRQTCDIKFMGPVFRSIALLIMIYSLIVNSVIDSVIISAITYPRNKPDINTLDELFYRTNLTMGVHNRHMELFKKSISDDYLQTIENRIETFSDKKIKEVLDKRQFQYAVLMRKADARFISRKPAHLENGSPVFHTMLECPIPCPIVYGVRYGSPYLARLNNIFHHLYQGGILQHWTAYDDDAMYKNSDKILYKSSGDDKERKALKIENLSEVFFVWMIGLLLSLIVLIAEIIVHTIHTCLVV